MKVYLGRIFTVPIFLGIFVLGTSQISSASDKDGLRFSAVGEKIQNNLQDLSIHAKEVFTDESSEILWFGQFQLFQQIHQSIIKVEWIKPDGSLYREHSYKPDPIHAPFTWSKLDIKGVDKEVLSIKGEWSVHVSKDGVLIDNKTFWVGYPVY